MTATDSTDRVTARDLSPTRGMAGRVFLSTAAIVCAVLFAALIVASYSARRATREAERRSLEQAADLTAQLLAGRGRSLAGGARVFVQGPSFRSLVAAGRHDDILDQAIEASGQLNADWVFITNEQGSLLAKSDEPSVSGVSMVAIPLVEGALEGRTTFGFGRSRDTLLFQTVAVPIVVPGAAPVGVLVATKLVDRQMAMDVRAATGADIVFYALDTHGKPHVAATSLDSEKYAAAALPDPLPNESPATEATNSAAAGPRAARTAIIGHTPYALQGAALTTSGGEVIGGFIVGHPENETSAQLAGIRRSLVIAGLLGLVLALGAAWSSARRVTRPTRALAAAAQHALEGEYDEATRIASETSASARSAEVAALGAALTAFLQELREKRALGALVDRSSSSNTLHNQSEAELHDERARVGRGRASGARTRGPLATQLGARVGTLTLPSGALAPGFVVAERYEIQDVVGVGGTGIVYRVKDRTLDEILALKMLRPELLADDPRAREELKQELRLTRRVSHRNIVRTHDFGVSRGIPYLTMEFVEGTSLAAVLARHGTLPTPVVLALARQLMRALDAAHEQGVMHGDVKPANLLLTNDGLLKVTDFGVASFVRRPVSSAASAGADDMGPPRLAGAVVGTPEYMAPELLLGGLPDVRADLYAAGMVLHECLTGATPFQGDTPRGFLAQKLDTPRETLIPPRGAGRDAGNGVRRPPTLAAVVVMMTEPDPEDRPDSAAAVSALLAQLG